MRDRGLAVALAIVLTSAFAGSNVARAATHDTEMPGVSQVMATGALPFGCVAALKDSATGSGAKAYASRYVEDGAYAYGEWRAGAFGGQSLWTKHGAAWCKVQTGIATLDRTTMVGRGVPQTTAARLLAKMHAVGDLAPPIAPRAAHAAVGRHR